MEALDEKIAMLERGQRMQRREEAKKEKGEIEGEGVHALSVDEIRDGIQRGKLCFPGQQEMSFKTNTLFPEEIPMILIDNFYPSRQETEDMVIYVNNELGVGQSMVHLPEDMANLTLDSWAEQVKSGMKEKGIYVEITKKEALPSLDYMIYRQPSKEGWIMILLFRVCRENRRVVGTFSCFDKDKETFGRLLEGMIVEMQQML